MTVLPTLPPYEHLTSLNPDRVARTADAALEFGWSRRQYPPIHLSGPIPWDLASPDQRSWNFYIHSLDMIDPLLAAHDQTGERKYLEPALWIGLDWARRHPRGAEGLSPMAWYDMAVGLRAYRLGYLFQAAETAGLLTDEDRDLLTRALEDHRAELADDATIAFHNNHGYYQVAGQLALGRRFRETSEPMAALYAQGRARLTRMLDQQFTPEGVHREHSPDYHRMVLDTLNGLITAGLVEDPATIARAEAIEAALAWFIYPSGRIVNFGDSDSRGMALSPAAAERKWRAPILRAAVAREGEGQGRPEGLRVFPEAGYAVVRRPDVVARKDPPRDSYLAQTAAFHSRTHKHADDLSFVWYDRGQEILVDAGRYGYIGRTETGSDLWQDGHWYSDPMRVFMESTRAHNTLEFDGRNARRKKVKPWGSALLLAEERDGMATIWTRCRQHGTIWYDRRLFFRPGQWLVVYDTFQDTAAVPHEVRQWFHLAPGHAVAPETDPEAEGGGYRIRLAEGGWPVSVRSLLPGPVAGPVISGRAEDPIQGWWSARERHAEPAPAFAFALSGAVRGAMATLFSLTPDAQPDPASCRVNPSGRRGQFAWRDASGRQEIRFDHVPPAPAGSAEDGEKD